MSRLRSVPLALLVIAGASLVLSGCAGSVPLDPAPDANDPGCAQITVRLPDSVAGLAKRETDAQATGAWGDPAAVLLRCGVPVPGPTTMPCLSVNGVDWIQDDAKAPESYRFITFGRKPATEVIIDHKRASNSTVLVDLSSAVSSVEPVGHCTSVTDSFDTGDTAPLTTSPSPSTAPSP